MISYTVQTRDVDGSTSRRYKTLAGARKRFESMAGHTLEQAIAEQFHVLHTLPAPDAVDFLRAVSNFGTVVTLARRPA